MVRKITIFCVVLIFIGVTIADHCSPLLGATICSILTFTFSTKFIRLWLIGLSQKLQRFIIRYPRHRRRKLFTISSSYILPWVEKLYNFFWSTKHSQRLINQTPSNIDDLSNDNEAILAELNTLFVQHCGNKPSSNEEVKIFVNNISKEYIKNWYQKISKNEEFVSDLDYILEDVLEAACDRLARLNINQFSHRLLILLYNHLLVYKDQELQKILEFKHPALSQKDTKQIHYYLANVCEILLDLLGPTDLLYSLTVRSLLVDILTKNLWFPLLNLLSDPKFVYSSLVFLIGDIDVFEKKVITYAEHANSNKRSSTDSKSLKRQTENKILNLRRLSKAKSFSYSSIDDIGLDIDSPTLPIRRTSSHSKSPTTPADKEFFHLTEEFPSNDKDQPLFCFFPVKSQLVERRSIPVHLLNGLPKKRNINSKIRSSKSLDTLNNTTDAENDDQQYKSSISVFQKFVSAQSRSPFKIGSKPRAKSPSVDVEEAEEVTEVMNLAPFFNIRIERFREQLDSKNKIYILYIIQFDYLDTVTTEGGEDQVVERAGVVERRFKEFITLQSKLEKSKHKNYLNGITGPSKFLVLKISPKDKKSIEKRRIFLQKYLQELCTREVFLVNEDFRGFLAFNGDPRIAFVRSGQNLPFQQFFQNVGTGVMEIFKLALPIGHPQENGCGDFLSLITHDKTPTQSRSILPSFGKSKYEVKLPDLIFNCNKASLLKQDIYNYLDRLDLRSSSPEPSRSNSPCNFPSTSLLPETNSLHILSVMPTWKRAALELDSIPVGSRSEGDGCDSTESKSFEAEQGNIQFHNLQDCLTNEIPLANTLTDIILCLLLSNHSLSDDYVTVAFKVIFGDLIQGWLQKIMKYTASKEKGVYLLHLLHSKLWPMENAPPKPVLNLQQYKAITLEILQSNFSSKMKFFLGEADLTRNLESLLDCLGDQTRNKNLILQILDVLIEMLCAQELEENPL